MLASDNMFPIEYRVANFVGRVQNTLESAEHMTPKSAQNANPYMRCSYDMLAHDVYSSSTSTGVSGWLGSMPALRAHATSSIERPLVSRHLHLHSRVAHHRRVAHRRRRARTSGGLYRCLSSPRSTSRPVSPRARQVCGIIIHQAHFLSVSRRRENWRAPGRKLSLSLD